MPKQKAAAPIYGRIYPGVDGFSLVFLGQKEMPLPRLLLTSLPEWIGQRKSGKKLYHHQSRRVPECQPVSDLVLVGCGSNKCTKMTPW